MFALLCNQFGFFLGAILLFSVPKWLHCVGFEGFEFLLVMINYITHNHMFYRNSVCSTSFILTLSRNSIFIMTYFPPHVNSDQSSLTLWNKGRHYEID